MIATPEGPRFRVTCASCLNCGDLIALNPSTGEWEHIAFVGIDECEDDE